VLKEIKEAKKERKKAFKIILGRGVIFCLICFSSGQEISPLFMQTEGSLLYLQ
jgi:hypothetical protein